MNIETRETNVPLSAELRDHVAHRVDAALRRFHDRVGRVRVWVEDMKNGARIGPDVMVCRIVAEIAPNSRLIAEAASDDPYAAVGKAAARLHGEVVKRVDRENGRHHRAPHERLSARQHAMVGWA